MDLSIASGSLLGHIDGFAEGLFYLKPESGGWSAAEIVEHLAILDTLIADVVYGPAVPAERVADAQIAEIRTVFENRTSRLHAPEAIAPKGQQVSKAMLTEQLRTARNRLFEATDATDLGLLCTSFTHRHFGQLTRLEWIYFAIFHGDRHLHQLLQLGSRTAQVSGTT